MKLGYVLFYVDSVPKSMEFYQKAFNMQPGFLHESNQYGEMITGGTKLGFVDHATASSHSFKYDKIEDLKNQPPFEIALVTDDVDAAFKHAIEAGAITLSQPAAKPWGQIVAYVKDCNGFTVELCSPMD